MSRFVAHAVVMRSYDVHVGDRAGTVRDFRAHIRATSASDAMVAARRAMPETVWHGTVRVYRRGRLRRRTLVGTYLAGGGPDDGLAGVREPRRPRPDLPGATAYAEPLVERGRQP